MAKIDLSITLNVQKLRFRAETVALAVLFRTGGGKDLNILFRRNVIILPYNVNFLVKTIKSIQVIFVPKKRT